MSMERQDHGPGGQTEDFGWALGVLLRAYQSALTGVLGDLPHGHRGFQVLSTVARGEQPSQLALAAYLGIDRSVMTHLLDDLVQAGLVERQPNPADRRQRKIVATDAGVQALHQLERRVHDAQDAVLTPLSPAERGALCDLVRRVARDIRDADTQQDPCELAAEVLAQQSVTSAR